MPEIAIIDTATNAQTGIVGGFTQPTSYGIAVAPSGSFAYVTGSSIDVIDTQTNTVVGSVSGVSGSGLKRVAFSPDGSSAYAMNEQEARVYVIDTATHTVRSTISGFGGRLFEGLTVSPDGTQVYVANFGQSSIDLIDTATARRIGTVSGFSGQEPAAVVFAGDGKTAYVATRAAISVIDVATSSEVASIPVSRANDIVLSADGRFLYTTDIVLGEVTMTDVLTRTAVGTFAQAVGRGAHQIRVVPGSHVGYVSNVRTGQITRIDLYRPNPVADAIQPARGTVDAAAPVTVSGNFLLGTTAVTFAGRPGSNLDVAPDGKSLSVIPPNGAPGTAEVQVQHPDGNTVVHETYTYYTVPGAPREFDAVAQADAVSLEWVEPASDGGDTIESYVISVAPSGTNQWTEVGETAETSFAVEGLSKGKEYQFRSAARNQAGDGPPAQVIVGLAESGVPTSSSPPPAHSTTAATNASRLAVAGTDAVWTLIVGTMALLGGLILLLRAKTRRIHASEDRRSTPFA
ncbi:fibronectin type III domain-containing protein [Plantibacter flavus]|nr:fibronectin type III domain-containing protein [Plantibacter flavus]